MAEINTCEVVVGRLMEIRVAAGYNTPEDVDDMIAMIVRCVQSVPATTNVIIAADWRAVRIMSPATAEKAKKMLSGHNPRIERSGILTLPEHPLTNLQVVRLIREGQHEARRHCTSTQEMHDWLEPLLSPMEKARLETFLPAER